MYYVLAIMLPHQLPNMNACTHTGFKMEPMMLGFLLLLLYGSCLTIVGGQTCEPMCKFGYYTAMEHSNLTWLFFCIFLYVGMAVCTGDRSTYQLYTLFLINTHAILYLSVAIPASRQHCSWNIDIEDFE